VSAEPATSFFEAKARALGLAQPLAVHLELTYRCNLNCGFCYNPRRHDLAPLALDEWEKVLDDLRELGTLWVTLTGGEPLVHPQFLAVAAAVRSRAMALKVFTNGSRVTEELADRLAAMAVAAVELSLHGASATTHDATTRCPGSFRAVLQAVDRLRRRGVSVLLKTPLTRLNEGEIDGMVQLCAEHGVPVRFDPRITARDDGDSSPLAWAPSPAALDALMARLSELGQLPVSTRTAGGTNCGLGRMTLAVDPEGNVFPCIQWRARALGNVRKVALRTIWRESQARQEAADVARHANDRLLTLGSDLATFPYCPAVAFAETGDPLLPDRGQLRVAAAAARARRGIG
jgi:MoaA/NifB/PqqE/SkfB family radical SAM enzyme